MRQTRFAWVLPALAVAVATPWSGAQGQRIATDGTTGPAQTLAGPNYAIGAGLGMQRGGNLFHSFSRFGLNAGETATFSGPSQTTNIIGRVTGSEASAIAGTVRSTIPGANLYLVNPNGIVFAPTARVDVGGSFHASSADYLRFQDGAEFRATNPGGSTLTAAPPVVFGFLSANPRSVTVEGATLGPVAGTLGLVGGPVTIRGGALVAPGGTVHVAGAAGPGEIPVDPRAGPAPTVARFAPVRVEGGARIAVSDPLGGSGGSVFIRAGALDVLGSEIEADNFGTGPGGAVSLRGDGRVTVAAGSAIRSVAWWSGRGADIAIGTAGALVVDGSSIATAAFDTGPGGRLAVEAGSLALRNGATLGSSTLGASPGGAVEIVAGSIVLSDPGTRLQSLVDPLAAFGSSGAGGPISVRGGSLVVRNGAQILSQTEGDPAGGAIGIRASGDALLAAGGSVVARTRGRGAGGTILLDAGGTLTLDATEPSDFQTGVVTARSPAAGVTPLAERGPAGTLTVSAGNVVLRGDGALLGSNAPPPPDRASIQVEAAGGLFIEDTGIAGGIAPVFAEAGAAPSISVTAETVSLLGAAAILSVNPEGAAARGGDVAVTARGTLALRGAGSLIGTENRALLPRAGGAATVAARDIAIEGGTLSSATSGAGEAGALRVNATGSLALTRDAVISGATFGAGDAGAVTVRAGTIRIEDSSIVASSAGTGRAGQVDVTATGALVMVGTPGRALPASIGAESTLAAVAGGAPQPGRVGDVTVNAGSLTMSGYSAISTDTRTGRDAGNLRVVVPGAVVIDGAGAPGRTGITSQAEITGAGNAGAVSLEAGSLTLRNGAVLSSDVRGFGSGGSVTVTLLGSLLIDGRSAADAPTGILARSEFPFAGPAGEVRVQAGDALLLGPGATISANSFNLGGGNAGSIQLRADRLVLRDGASLSTRSLLAEGGNIELSIRDLLYLRNSSVTTSVEAALGNGGNIVIDPRFVVLDSSLIQANAFGGNGGNILIVAERFVPSADSTVTASSRFGLAGAITLSTPPLDPGGSLVVLASELRAAAALLRESCAVQGANPRSSLVLGGRGGVRQEPGATLPSLYFANRPLRAGLDEAPAAPLQTRLMLSVRCEG